MLLFLNSLLEEGETQKGHETTDWVRSRGPMAFATHPGSESVVSREGEPLSQLQRLPSSLAICRWGLLSGPKSMTMATRRFCHPSEPGP